MRRDKAITLVELIVVLSVLALLIAITAPAIRGARRAALEVAVLAHQSQVGGVLRAYVDDHDNRFPYFGVPGTNDALAIVAHYFQFRDQPLTPDNVESNGYWRHLLYWALYMCKYEGYEEAALAFSGPEHRYRPVDDSLIALDWLTAAAYADPPYFQLKERGGGSLRDHQAQRWDKTRFPSLKGLLVRTDGVEPRTARSEQQSFIWFADSHGELLAHDRLRDGVLFTRMGLWGRDK